MLYAFNTRDFKAGKLEPTDSSNLEMGPLNIISFFILSVWSNQYSPVHQKHLIHFWWKHTVFIIHLEVLAALGYTLHIYMYELCACDGLYKPKSSFRPYTIDHSTDSLIQKTLQVMSTILYLQVCVVSLPSWLVKQLPSQSHIKVAWLTCKDAIHIALKVLFAGNISINHIQGHTVSPRYTHKHTWLCTCTHRHIQTL